MTLNNSPKANATAFVELFEQLHPYEFALLRERMITMMHITKRGATETPDDYENEFATSKDYVRLANKVLLIIGFE